MVRMETPATRAVSVVRFLSWRYNSLSNVFWEVAMTKRKPIPLHEITLDALMASPSLWQEQEDFLQAALKDESLFDRAWPANPLKTMLNFVSRERMSARAVPSPVPGFLIASHVDDLGRAMVAVFEQDTGTLAGGAEGKNIIVRDGFQRRGIGVEILIKAFEIGLFHPEDMNERNYLSAGGRALRRSAHKIAISRALAAGVSVRPDVLGPYPDLRPHLTKVKFRDLSNEGKFAKIEHHLGVGTHPVPAEWVRWLVHDFVPMELQELPGKDQQSAFDALDDEDKLAKILRHLDGGFIPAAWTQWLVHEFVEKPRLTTDQSAQPTGPRV